MKINRILYHNRVSLELDVLDQFGNFIEFRMSFWTNVKEDAKNCESLVLRYGFREGRESLTVPVDEMKLIKVTGREGEE